jgi:hypothetical protein
LSLVCSQCRSTTQDRSPYQIGCPLFVDLPGVEPIGLVIEQVKILLVLPNMPQADTQLRC